MGLNVFLSVLLSGWFSRIGWIPLGGLALANSVATGLEAVCLFFLMRRRLAGIEGMYIFEGTGKAVVSMVVMALVLWSWLGMTTDQPVWLVGVGGVLLGGAVYGLCMLLLRVPEAGIILNLLKRRLNLVTK
jgi:putative peptidoglycan lipid II flippase